MKFQKQLINIIAILFFLNLVFAQDTVEEEEEKPELILAEGPITGDYKKNDLDETYDESSIEIECDGTTCTSSSDDVSLSEGNVVISKQGTYILSGELNGLLTIAATKEDLIHLVLRNATITSDFGPAVYGEKCKKLVITTEGTNTISDSANYPESANKVEEEEEEEEGEEGEAGEEKEAKEEVKRSPNACIFISNNLTFNGKGTLNVNANFDEGIRCKKNLKFISGKINVISKGKAVKAKDSVSIKEAELNIEAGTSGIKVTKETDPEGGFVVIDGGVVIVRAMQDGIHAETHLSINGGFVDVVKSAEGLEGQMIDITGGEVYVNSLDDGMNSSKVGSKGGQPPPPPFMNGTDPFGQPYFGQPFEGNGQMQGGFQGGNIQMSSQTKGNQVSIQDDISNKNTDEIETDIDYIIEELNGLESETEFLEPLIDDEDSDFIDDSVTLDANEDSEFESDEEDENTKYYKEPGITRSVITVTEMEFPTEYVEGPNMLASSPYANGQFPFPPGFGPPPPPLEKNYEDDNKVYVRITGGKVYIVVAGGDVDGIDSNGSLYIGADAEVYISNSSGGIYGTMATVDAGGSLIIDYYATALLTGIGMSGPPPPPGMMNNGTIEEVMTTFPEYKKEEIMQVLEEKRKKEPPPPGGFPPPGFEGEDGQFFPPPPPGPPPPGFDEEGTVLQPYIKVKLEYNQPIGTDIIVKDSDDEVLIEHKSRAQFGEILFTSPKIIEGETYTVIAGNSTATAVAIIDELKEIPTTTIDFDEEIPTDEIDLE